MAVTRYKDYKGYDVYYHEEDNTWQCEDMVANSYKDLLKKIEEKIKESKNFKLTPMQVLFDSFEVEMKTVTVSSAQMRSSSYYRDENKIGFWVTDNSGKRTLERCDFCRISQEYFDLLNQYKTARKKVKQYIKNNKYTPEEILRNLGYPEAYIKSNFNIETDNQDE